MFFSWVGHGKRWVLYYNSKKWNTCMFCSYYKYGNKIIRSKVVVSLYIMNIISFFLWQEFFKEISWLTKLDLNINFDQELTTKKFLQWKIPPQNNFLQTMSQLGIRIISIASMSIILITWIYESLVHKAYCFGV